jgi:hypothetical protein
MTIGALNEEEFNCILEKHLRPSRPVDTPELLFGREPAIERMKEAYGSAGRQVFIYGDRGVGKTSVAKTAAFALNSAFSAPVYVACAASTTFASLLTFIYGELVGDESQQRKVTKTAGVDLKAFHASASTETVSGARQIHDVNTALSGLRSVCPTGGRRRVIVIDEFDLIGDEKERALFAGFIKQLGDQEINACFIFVGIGRSLDELLKAHESCFRYLESVPLDRLNFTGRWEIIDKCSEALNVTVNEDSRLRIAQISDGFPHYVHLVSQKLFWEAFRSEDSIREISPDYYQAAVRTAVLSIEYFVKQSYDTATKKYKDDYEEVLWAVADHYELLRNTEMIYGSYRRIMEIRGKDPMSRKAMSFRLNSLKSDMCGRILVSPRRSWYEFKDSFVRGYVRLRAEEKGVSLALEHEPAKDPPPILPSSSRRARVPSGR